MRKFWVVMWMSILIAFFHMLFYSFGQWEPSVKTLGRENDHVKNTEIIFIDDYSGQQGLVPARPFVKPYRKPGERQARKLLKAKNPWQ